MWTDEVTFWEAAVRRSPDQIIPKIKYVEALRKSGRVDEAIRQHLTALGPDIESTDRGKAMVTSSLASDYIQKGDFLNAEKYLNTALEYNPQTEGQYYYHMGLIYLRKNDPESAGNFLRKAVDIGPGDAKAHYLLGLVYFMEADVDKSVDKYRLAESSFLNALKCAPGFVKAKIYLARVYLILGEKENARKQARAALELTADPAILNEAKTIMNALNASP